MKQYLFETLEDADGVPIVSLESTKAEDDSSALYDAISFSFRYGVELTGLYRVEDKNIVVLEIE
jgi:hypothetical protein